MFYHHLDRQLSTKFFLLLAENTKKIPTRENVCLQQKRSIVQEKREKNKKKRETAVMLKLIIRDRNTNGRETRGKKTTLSSRTQRIGTKDAEKRNKRRGGEKQRRGGEKQSKDAEAKKQDATIEKQKTQRRETKDAEERNKRRRGEKQKTQRIETSRRGGEKTTLKNYFSLILVA